MAISVTGTNLVPSSTGQAPWEPGHEFTTLSKYTIAATVLTGDVYTFANMLPPLNLAVQLLSVEFYGVELDTNSSPTATLVLGDGTTTNAYLTSKTAGNAVFQLHYVGDGANIGTVITVSRNIVATVGGTVATGQTSGDVFCKVRYRCVGAQS